MRRVSGGGAVLVCCAWSGHAAAQSVYLGFDAGFPAPLNSQAVPIEQRVNSSAANGAFRAALEDEAVVGFEQVEGFALGVVNPSAAFPGGLSAQFTGAIVRDSFGPGGGINSASPEGRYPASGAQFLNCNASSLIVDFSQPVVAFGFWATDLGDFIGSIQIELIGSGSTTLPVAIPPLQERNASILFWGVISDSAPFTRLRLTNAGFGGAPVSDIFAFDDCIAVAAVPAPSTLFVCLSATALMLRRRR